MIENLTATAFRLECRLARQRRTVRCPGCTKYLRYHVPRDADQHDRNVHNDPDDRVIDRERNIRYVVCPCGREFVLSLGGFK